MVGGMKLNRYLQTKHPWVLGTLVAMALLLAFEGGLRVLGIGDPNSRPDPLQGFSTAKPLFRTVKDRQGIVWLETAQSKLLHFNYQRFPLDKPARERRVFCLGGSTTYGRPFDAETSFCGWLQSFLESLVSEHRWRVVNLGGISYSSHRIQLMLPELMLLKPDLFILYTGHNEFLERRTYGWLTQLPRPLLAAMAGLMGTHLYGAIEAAFMPRRAASDDVAALLDWPEGWDAYTRATLGRETVRRDFAANVSAIADIISADDVAQLWVLPSSNEADFPPFKTELGTLPKAEAQQFDALLTEYESAQDPLARLRIAKQAVALDPEHASAQFQLGRAALDVGENSIAAQAFQAAIDQDIVALRMTSPLRRALKDTLSASERPFLDFDAILRRAKSGDAALFLGNDEFLDHVHPTIDGHRLLALAILKRLSSDGQVQVPASWFEFALPEVTREKLEAIDPRRQINALLNLGKVMAWARQFQTAHRHYRRAFELSEGEERPRDYLARVAAELGYWNEVRDLYLDAVRTGRLTESLADELPRTLLRGKGLPVEARRSLVRSLMTADPDNTHLPKVLTAVGE